MVFCPRHAGFRPTSKPRASHVMYASSANTSFEVVAGGSFTFAPVAFSLRRKQSTMRSPRLYRRPERRLYSGNMPATPTNGRDRSLCPPFRWQLLQDILLGANCGASPGVFVKIRKPQRTCFDKVDWSSAGSVSGFFGKNQAVTIVVRAETRGPLNW